MSTRKTIKLYSLVYIHRESDLLLGRKKCGFAIGTYNGFGGKVEPNESIDECAIRELREECSLVAKDLVKHGVITFDHENVSHCMEVHIYRATDFKGEPTSSVEMEPKWFPCDQIPYDLMLPDTRHWLPLLLKRKFFSGYFKYDNNKQIVGSYLNEVRRDEVEPMLCNSELLSQLRN